MSASKFSIGKYLGINNNNFFKSFSLPNKLGNKVAMLYENYLIPPQNESLIEIKRKEFRERTKYLDPKVLYTLTAEEKTDLRNSGYFVDLDEKSVREIKNFKMSYNRHDGRYSVNEPYNNFAFQNTKYYYTDQNHALFTGDPLYYNKIWRNRTFWRYKLFKIICAFVFFNLYYRYRLKQHNQARKKIKKIAENNPSILIPAMSLP